MFITVTSIYGKPCKVTINGGSVTVNGKPLSIEDAARYEILARAHELAETIERELNALGR